MENPSSESVSQKNGGLRTRDRRLMAAGGESCGTEPLISGDCANSGKLVTKLN